ncbi:VACUOLAR MEMBRANE PROTEIN YOR292C [Ceraceosorus bombacis]|nr:VACUOLAR MEMBRANE PROTEIN YOR292C [Ceraceosorus bombacis]
MPLKYRVPFVSLCGVGWTIFLSVLQAARQGGTAEAAIGSGGADGGVQVHS